MNSMKFSLSNFLAIIIDGKHDLLLFTHFFKTQQYTVRPRSAGRHKRYPVTRLDQTVYRHSLPVNKYYFNPFRGQV